MCVETKNMLTYIIIDNNYIIVLNYSAILKRNAIKINNNQFQLPDIENTLGVEKIKINRCLFSFIIFY